MSDIFNPAIAYLCTYLDRRDLTFDYVNSFQEEKDRLAAKLQDYDIQLVAITTSMYMSFEPVVEIVDFVKRYNDSVPIVAGGPFIATLIRNQGQAELNYILNEMNADFYVNSAQGESTLVNLIQSLKTKRSVADVNNIYYRQNGKYVATLVKPEDNELSKNMINWKLFGDGVKSQVILRTSVSCPFSCAFCTFPVFGGKFQTASIEGVEYELNQLAELNRVNIIAFLDDTFNFPKERFKKILRMMIKNNYQFKWMSFFRCQFADEETIALMKESGCLFAYLGLESGNDTVLKNMNKATTVELYRKGLDLLHKYDIPTFGSFIIGFPGETKKSIADTVAMINDVDFYESMLWANLADAPVNKQREKFKLEGSEYEWKHETMDSRTANRIIENEILPKVKSARVPIFDYDVLIILSLLDRGMSFEQVKKFITAFNKGVMETIQNPSIENVDDTIIGEIKESFN
ncbi:MAG: radical SAM protein [Cytophagales bacterium]|nr:radical SAM protein [Cytophagales bacterium]